MIDNLRQIIERGIGPGTFGVRGFNPWEEFVARPSGLLVPGYVELAAKVNRVPIGIDLFSGAGGFSLGFIEAGFEVIAALEWDCVCAHTYLVNLGGPETQIVFIEECDRERWEKYCKKALHYQKKGRPDIEKIDYEPARRYFEGIYAGMEEGKWGGGWHSHNGDKPIVKYFFLGDARKVTGQFILEHLGMQPGEVDCVMGGPPCQGFTSAGKRNVMDPRNSLVIEFCRLVVEMKPKTCIMENVPGILSMVTPEGLPVVDCLCRILSDGGMGTFDALKRSLFTTSGAGAIVRTREGDEKHYVGAKEFSKLGKHKKEPKKSAEEEDSPQLELFPSERV